MGFLCLMQAQKGPACTESLAVGNAAAPRARVYNIRYRERSSSNDGFDDAWKGEKEVAIDVSQ